MSYCPQKLLLKSRGKFIKQIGGIYEKQIIIMFANYYASNGWLF